MQSIQSTPTVVSLSDILTPVELSKLLKIKPTTIYEWMRRRDCPDAIPYFRVGRFLRFSKAEVSAWMLKSRASGDLHAHHGGANTHKKKAAKKAVR